MDGVAAAGLLSGCATLRPATPKAAVSRRGASVVGQWTELMLDAVRAGSVPPPVAARAFAMGHTAGFAAVNAIQPVYGTPCATGSGPAGADMDTVYATAAAGAASAGLGIDMSGALSDYLLGNGKTGMRAIK